MKTFAAAQNSESDLMQRIPLIRKKMPIDVHQLKKFSLYLGLLVGCFIQFSTLGANYLAIAVWGNDIVHSSRQDVLIFSLLWSCFASTLALVILAILRNLVMASYSSHGHGDDSTEMDVAMLHMECRFIVGALVGVCVAWAVTDFALGMSGQIIYSIGTLMVSLVWCKGIMWCFSPRAIDEKDIPSDDILIV